MKDLIREYKQGRADLRKRVTEIKREILATDDESLAFDLKHKKSIFEGMLRDMSDTIKLMENKHHKLRGMSKDANENEFKVITMDPNLISLLNISDVVVDQDDEQELRSRIVDQFGPLIKKRMHLLTAKQRSTLHRWIFEGKRLFEIAQDDGVSRQSVHERLFGNRTHQGAIKKLRDGKG